MNTKTDNLNSIGILVADHVTAMLAYWDKNLVCRFANAAYRDWFGKTREEMVGKITIDQLLGPLYQMNLPYIIEALKGNPQQFEREIPTPDGGLRYSLANYFPDIQNGEVQGFFVHVADISQKKLLEKELIQSNEIIQQQNKLLLNFSNVVSHNLKSYANNLQLLTETLMSDIDEELKKEALGYLQELATGLGTTIKNLNEITKAQNLGDTSPEIIPLAHYIDKAKEILRVQIKNTHTKLVSNIPDDAGVLTNPAYLESIILNFLTNAIKYRHPDRYPLIELNCEINGGYLILHITDNGLGIDMKKHGKSLFSIYKTFHGNSDAQGLGLYITKYQVEAMGGKIEVESEPDKGTTFSVFFRHK